MRTLILSLALTLCACARPDGGACTDFRAGSGPSRLLAFGDSQTTGHGEESSRGCGFSYANALSLAESRSLEMLAVGGSKFVSDLEFGALMQTELRSSDRIVMLIGFNDMRSAGVDPEHLADFSEALESALRRVSPLVTSVTIGTTLDPIDYGTAGSRAAVDAYRAAVHAVVDRLALANVRAFDPDESLSRNPAYFVEDRIHINRAGQELLAEQFRAEEAP